jgi:hypothetical protein
VPGQVICPAICLIASEARQLSVNVTISSSRSSFVRQPLAEESQKELVNAFRLVPALGSVIITSQIHSFSTGSETCPQFLRQAPFGGAFATGKAGVVPWSSPPDFIPPPCLLRRQRHCMHAAQPLQSRFGIMRIVAIRWWVSHPGLKIHFLRDELF